MTLEQTLAELCADCEHVGCAWMSPDGTAFVLEAARHIRWTMEKRTRKANLELAEPHALAAVNEVFASIVKRHPNVIRELCAVVSYSFHPGAGWRDVYRKPDEKKQRKQDDE